MMSKTVCALGALLCAVLVAPARADIILTPGNIPQIDENVLLGTVVPGNPVFGETNQTGLSVEFLGAEDLTSPAGGQARIEAQDGFFTELAISVPGGSFTSLIFNLDATANGTVNFVGLDTDGQSTAFNNVLVGAGGQNFFTFTAINGQRIDIISLVANGLVQFSNAQQFRIGGGELDVTVISEPSMLALFGTAVAAAAALYRRRLRPVKSSEPTE